MHPLEDNVPQVTEHEHLIIQVAFNTSHEALET